MRTLILIRHGHREVGEDRSSDNGLSNRGKEQALSISSELLKKFKGQVPLLLASPKVRCIETLLPLSDATGVQVKVVDLLDEQHESEKAFLRRVDTFFRWWTIKAPPFVVACSHGDWIPAFTQRAAGATVDLQKGALVQVLYTAGKIKLLPSV